MSTPHFTAEASLYNAPGVVRLINRNGTSPNSRDLVIPQWSCGFQYCYCSGFEDCRQMVYVSQICYDAPSCTYSPNGIDCQCQWASV